MNIREATEKDFDAIWPIFHEIVSAGETYAYPQNTTRNEALNVWQMAGTKTIVPIWVLTSSHILSGAEKVRFD